MPQFRANLFLNGNVVATILPGLPQQPLKSDEIGWCPRGRRMEAFEDR
jgi:hypothetical protein